MNKIASVSARCTTRPSAGTSAAAGSSNSLPWPGRRSAWRDKPRPPTSLLRRGRREEAAGAQGGLRAARGGRLWRLAGPRFQQRHRVPRVLAEAPGDGPGTGRRGRSGRRDGHRRGRRRAVHPGRQGAASRRPDDPADGHLQPLGPGRRRSSRPSICPRSSSRRSAPVSR